MPYFQNTTVYDNLFFKKAYPEMFQPGTGNFLKDISFLWFEQKIIIKQVSEPYNLNNLYKFHQQKYHLKKALRSGRIEISALSLDKKQNLLPINKQGIVYTWRKGLNLNFPTPTHMPNIFKNRRSPSFSTQKYSYILKQLQDFPVFIVRNGFTEMSIGIIHYSSTPNFLNMLYNIYLDYCIWTKDKDVYSLGLFFMNPNDALEFQNTMSYKYPRSAKELDLSIAPIKFNLAYKLNRTSPPHIQFRFIPDFQEISKLLKVYKYHKNITFHPKQIYGNNYFQGQPLYIINNINEKNEHTKQYLFTSKTVLDAVCNNSSINHKRYNFQKNNMITVYNLEDFLCDLEEHEACPFNLVTNSDAYEYIKNETISQKESMINSLGLSIKKQVLFLNIWAKRIVWALTHIELPN